MKKLILIDGSSLLSTCFFGTIPKDYFFAKTEEERKTVLARIMQTSAGIYTNAVFAMVKALIKLLRLQKPSHMAVAWDMGRNTFRKKLYSDYKAHREETKPELRSQFELMQELLAAMNIAQFKYEDYEADDIVGTLAKTFEGQLPIYILSKDQDVLQLVSEHIRAWLITDRAKEMYKDLGLDTNSINLPENYFEFTPEYVKVFYGLSPEQLVDKKALEGDKSDNIPGVMGIGPKASIPLITEFGNIENLYRSIEGIEGKEEQEIKQLFKMLGISRSPLSYLLKEGKDGDITGKQAAILSKHLAQICTDIEELNKVTLEELAVNINHEKTLDMFRRLEFYSLLELWEKGKPTKETTSENQRTISEEAEASKEVKMEYFSACHRYSKCLQLRKCITHIDLAPELAEAYKNSCGYHRRLLRELKEEKAKVIELKSKTQLNKHSFAEEFEKLQKAEQLTLF